MDPWYTLFRARWKLAASSFIHELSIPSLFRVLSLSLYLRSCSVRGYGFAETLPEVSTDAGLSGRLILFE